MTKHSNIAAGGRRVAIFGEALVDVFKDAVVPGGAPFNVARHLAAFGVDVCLITRIGNDDHAMTLRREIGRFGLPCGGVQVDAVLPTGAVRVHETPEGHRFEIPAAQAFDAIDARAAVAALDAFGEVDIVSYGTLIQRAEPSRKALAAVLAGCPHAVRYLDLNLRPDGVPVDTLRDTLFEATILKVSDEELWEIATPLGACRPAAPGEEPDLAEIDLAIQAVMRAAPSVGLVIVTLGRHGSAACLRGSRRLLHAPGADGVRVVDTVGAGDAFSSVMILGRLHGWPLATTLARANVFAAAICGIQGAVPAELGLYDGWIEAWSLGPAARCA
jgi:fructokinase